MPRILRFQETLLSPAKPCQPAHGVPISLPHMLTKHPNIVIALPPKRGRRKQAKAAPILTSRIADHSKPLPLHDPEQAGAAADRLWQELVRSVNQAAPDQPAPGRKNRRTRSGQ